MEIEKENSFCKQIPSLFSSFVDTFVDFSVSGFFLLPPPSSPPPPLPTRLPSPQRLIAIGDLHGDLKKSKEALRIAGLIDASDRYTGGSSTVVQIGDILDRGGDEIKILYLMEKLKREAARSGGRIVTMNGNHEIMNVEGDFRFATRSGLKEFRVWLYWYREGNKMKSLCKGFEPVKDPLDGVHVAFPGVRKKYHDGFRARVAALRPNGPISRRFFSQNVTVLVVGDSVFVHGGLLQEHVNYGLEKINKEVSDWFKGLYGHRFSPQHCRGKNAVVWLRKFSDGNCDCSSLEHVLSTIPGVKRMIMGHTIQTEGINSVCRNKAIRIDVGMSKGCGDGLPEVLEIDRIAGVRILTSNALYQGIQENVDVRMEEEGFGMLVNNQHDRPRQVEVKA
ncbi:shewanella-like protein phosphatase 2 [Lathyrus oleraceus]|uniref:shewanella-like protein phosphatase 2 n=1 Tax=Pisum sativum TaxID=3888 RepID=UPI0021CF1DE2|nr:shewanella-like protein phosphatase 2 [Pisum sativum]KAI5382259.1 Shewanella-like protein phosphatase 2 [Pisum sativum]